MVQFVYKWRFGLYQFYLEYMSLSSFFCFFYSLNKDLNHKKKQKQNNCPEYSWLLSRYFRNLNIWSHRRSFKNYVKEFLKYLKKDIKFMFILHHSSNKTSYITTQNTKNLHLVNHQSYINSLAQGVFRHTLVKLKKHFMREKKNMCILTKIVKIKVLFINISHHVTVIIIFYKYLGFWITTLIFVNSTPYKLETT